MSLVRPGVLLTCAKRCPARALRALDLPVFERPAKAISPALAGACSSEATLLKKIAPRKGNMGNQANLLEYQPFSATISRENRHEGCVGACGLDDLHRPACRRRARGEGRFCQGTKHCEQGLRRVPRCRRQQPDSRQPETREPDSGVYPEATRQLQGRGGKEGR